MCARTSDLSEHKPRRYSAKLRSYDYLIYSTAILKLSDFDRDGTLKNQAHYLIKREKRRGAGRNHRRTRHGFNTKRVGRLTSLTNRKFAYGGGEQRPQLQICPE